MGNLSRLPNDNRVIPPRCNPWGGHSDVLDDTALLLNEIAKRCTKCQRVIVNKHLRKKDDKPYCLNCAGPEAPLFFEEEPAKQRVCCACGEDGDAD